jgi:hypothetical protein
LFSTELGRIVRDDVHHKRNYLIKLITNEFKTGFGPDPMNSTAFGLFPQK